MQSQITLLKLQPILREMVWGGNRLNKLFHSQGNKPVGEAWILSDFGEKVNTIMQGQYEGESFHSILERWGCKSFLGSEVQPDRENRFPLLIKLLDVSGKLSVQVHPGERDVTSDGPDRPKHEMWHFIESNDSLKENAQIVYGLNRFASHEELRQAVNNNEIHRYLKNLNVFPGDTVYIPAGTLHTISGMAFVYEVQLASDTTYRIYDWGRVGLDSRPRELHVEKGLRVTYLSLIDSVPIVPAGYYIGESRIIFLVATRFFTVKKLIVRGSLNQQTGGKSFHALTCIIGHGSIIADGIAYSVAPFETVFIPGAVGLYSLISKEEMIVLSCSQSDLKRDVIDVLTHHGITQEDIIGIGGPKHANDLIPLVKK